jgi:hypothetical protein
LALVSSKTEVQSIKVDLPVASGQQWNIRVLNSSRNGEADYQLEESRQISDAQTLSFTLPAYSLLIATSYK